MACCPAELLLLNSRAAGKRSRPLPGLERFSAGPRALLLRLLWQAPRESVTVLLRTTAKAQVSSRRKALSCRQSKSCARCAAERLSSAAAVASLCMPSV